MSVTAARRAGDAPIRRQRMASVQITCSSAVSSTAARRAHHRAAVLDAFDAALCAADDAASPNRCAPATAAAANGLLVAV